MEKGTSQTMKSDKWLNVKEIAELLDCCVSTVWDSIKKVPDYPQPYKLSRKITRFRLSEVESYIELRRKNRIAS